MLDLNSVALLENDCVDQSVSLNDLRAFGDVSLKLPDIKGTVFE